MPASRRRLIVPEVIQTSKTDCGPAALKAMLEGFGIGVSYTRLREVCQTDVDGTSVDRLEQIANELGLDTEQVVVPVDHVLLTQSHVLPGIVVVSSPAGHTHLVVAWRTHGSLVQVMDPARGRLWMSRRAFVQQLYVHTTIVSASAWRDWAETEEFIAPLRARLSALGLSSRDIETHLAEATADPSWRGLAALDASIRLLATLRETRALDRADMAAALSTFTAAAHRTGSTLPDHCWSVRLAEPDPDGEPQLSLRGAVIVRALVPQRSGGVPTVPSRSAVTDNARSPEVKPVRWAAFGPTIRGVVRLLREDGCLGHVVVAGALAIAVIGMTFEMLLLRSVLDLGASIRVPEQRLILMAALAMFGGALLATEWVLAAAERRLGSRLEARARIALFEQIPRLSDRYFQTRPMSDMAERSHSVHNLRLLPSLGIRCLRTAMELVLTTAAIVWFAPSVAGFAIAGALVTAAIPLLGHSFIAERDLRHRTHAGALARFNFDALMGRSAIDAHSAGGTLEREHEQLLGEWAGAGAALQRSTVAVEGLQITVGFCVAGWLIVNYFDHRSDMSGMLLLVYWVLNLPALGYELALNVREYPFYRSTILRLLELLEGADDIRPFGSVTLAQGRQEEAGAIATAEQHAGGRLGADLDLRGATVGAADQTILRDISVHIPSGSHVAIVGPSGAGKSTLASLLLGFHPLAGGEVLVDGHPLTDGAIENLRRRTAWVDPTVRIWNRSLLDNLLYGSDRTESIGAALEAAELLPVVTRLQDGLGTCLGEGGTLLSAGEAQRVRLGRVLMQPAPSLVLLDEPFRGLERERRRTLLARIRERWPHSTVLYITHDIAEASAFDRVLVIDRGRLIEDGEPVALVQRPSSRYRRMLHAQETLHARFGAGTEWRRIKFADGRIVHQGADVAIEQTA
jgi:ABC-type bacteriocin/lantibiotic exporter with double-glycine peptidase domain